MPRRPKGSIPVLQHHKSSDRARVTINGRDHWLGKWGSPEAQLAYERLIAEFLATRRIREVEPTAKPTVVSVAPGTAGAVVSPTTPADANAGGGEVTDEFTVAEVVLRYLEYCDTYYRKPSGERTSTYGNALQAARALRPFDDTPVAKFGPRKLGMIRDSEATRGRPRVGCNALIKHIRRVFRWAESQELVPRGTHESLKTVEPLYAGRTPAPELPDIKPVEDEVIEATLPHLPEIVADMVRVQRLTDVHRNWETKPRIAAKHGQNRYLPAGSAVPFPISHFFKNGKSGVGHGGTRQPAGHSSRREDGEHAQQPEGRAARREGRSRGRCPWRVIEHPLGVMRLSKKGIANRDGCRRWASRSFPGSYSGGKLRVLVHRQARRISVAIRLDSLGIDRLSVRDRLDLIEQIWDSLPEQVEPQDIPAWHVAELATRRRRAAESPAGGQPWREVLQRLEGGS